MLKSQQDVLLHVLIRKPYPVFKELWLQIVLILLFLHVQSPLFCNVNSNSMIIKIMHLRIKSIFFPIFNNHLINRSLITLTTKLTSYEIKMLLLMKVLEIISWIEYVSCTSFFFLIITEPSMKTFLKNNLHIFQIISQITPIFY